MSLLPVLHQDPEVQYIGRRGREVMYYSDQLDAYIKRLVADATLAGAVKMRNRVVPSSCGPQCSPYECEAAALIKELQQHE